jgi:hypothetical protein
MVIALRKFQKLAATKSVMFAAAGVIKAALFGPAEKLACSCLPCLVLPGLPRNCRLIFRCLLQAGLCFDPNGTALPHGFVQFI